MTDEIKPEVINKTQEVLGKFIKKPTLTEKLLKKPPFRFLHDICTSVMKETGFFEQILGPEDKIENIKDKEGKIEFLQKVIAGVEAASGIKLTLKPSKVVAGLEPTKTNEFLQALGKALEKQQEKKNSKTTLQTKTKSKNKPVKEVKEEPPDKKKPGKNSKKVEENGVNESFNHKSKTDGQTPRSPNKKYSKKQEPSTPGESGNIFEDERVKNKALNNGIAEEEKREERPQKDVHGSEESKHFQDVNIVKANRFDSQGDQNFKAKEEITANGEQRPGHLGKPKHRRSSINVTPDQAKLVDALENRENLGKEAGESNDSTLKEKVNTLNKSELQNQITPTTLSQINYSKKDSSSLVKEGIITSRPRTGIRPITARPASARPAAPRIRDRGDIAVSEEIIKPVSGKVQVIVDEETTNEADDENLISLEISNDIEETTPIFPQSNLSAEQEHGHLVEQILEVQRELEDDGRKETGKTEIEWESNKARESTNREIETLRTNIQSLTRTVNPLGKLLDFFQEDIEIVQKELENWKEKNASYYLQIAQEKSITDQCVEPLKIHLKELQKNIDEQIEQINVVKANIIRNNEKIHKMLSGL